MGPLINCGSDFGIMPSLFEPGGIVQHEFFLGATPVIAFHTGGLKDTIIEFDSKTCKGNGFFFKNYKREDLNFAIDRAYEVFCNQELFANIKKNAFESVIDVLDVAVAWNMEFYRIAKKVLIRIIS